MTNLLVYKGRCFSQVLWEIYSPHAVRQTPTDIKESFTQRVNIEYAPQSPCRNLQLRKYVNRKYYLNWEDWGTDNSAWTTRAGVVPQRLFFTHSRQALTPALFTLRSITSTLIVILKWISVTSTFLPYFSPPYLMIKNTASTEYFFTIKILGRWLRMWFFDWNKSAEGGLDFMFLWQ